MRASATSGSPLWQKRLENGWDGGEPPSFVGWMSDGVGVGKVEEDITECNDSAIGEQSGGEDGGG